MKLLAIVLNVPSSLTVPGTGQGAVNTEARLTAVQVVGTHLLADHRYQMLHRAFEYGGKPKTHDPSSMQVICIYILMGETRQETNKTIIYSKMLYEGMREML